MAHNQSKVAEKAQTPIQANWVAVRGNREPLDSSSVMLTYTELGEYISSNKSVYDGQLVSVSDLENNTYNGIYYIKYEKDENNNYSYTANKISLEEIVKLLENNLIDNERVTSLMSNYLHDSLLKDEQTLSFAINHLYSKMESDYDDLYKEIHKNEITLTDYLTYCFEGLDMVNNNYIILSNNLSNNYYTKTQTNNLLNNKSDVGHTHSDLWEEINNLLNNKSDVGHTHSDLWEETHNLWKETKRIWRLISELHNGSYDSAYVDRNYSATGQYIGNSLNPYMDNTFNSTVQIKTEGDLNWEYNF